jgi:hypothetical protein
MQKLVLYLPGMQQIALASVQSALREGFQNLRYDDPAGAAVEADFTVGLDSTIVRLNQNRQAISLSGSSGAAIHAALILQKRIDADFRITDLDYSFDLPLRDYVDPSELQAAIAAAQAS